MTLASTQTPSLREPLALFPIGLSLTALVLTALAIRAGGAIRQPDEGAAAHLFQLFMAGSALGSAAFAIRWLPRAPWPALRILAVHAAAACAALAPVAYFKL